MGNGVEQRFKRRAAVGALKEKIGMGVMRKGGSFSPKWSRYIESPPGAGRRPYCCFCADSMREYSVVRLMPSILAA